jgi:hypothetical protein
MTPDYVTLRIEHHITDASLGEYIREHLRRGISVIIKPTDEYVEEAAKPFTPLEHLDLGAKKF